jgi:hypothetical protein
MREILLEESPDLILCCRDEDTLALSQLKIQHPELPGALPVVEPQAALIGLDKWQTWLFTRKHSLAYAESFMPGQSGDDGALEAFGQRVGYPLIAKPTRGARLAASVSYGILTMLRRWHSDQVICSKNTSAIPGAWSRTSQSFKALRRCLPISRTRDTTFAIQ